MKRNNQYWKKRKQIQRWQRIYNEQMKLTRYPHVWHIGKVCNNLTRLVDGDYDGDMPIKDDCFSSLWRVL